MMLTRRSRKIDIPRRHSHRNAAPLIILPLAAATIGTYLYVINRTKVKDDGSLEEWRNRTSGLTPSWDRQSPVRTSGVDADVNLGQDVSARATPAGVSPTEDVSRVEPLYDSGDRDMRDRRPSDTDAPVSRDMPGDTAFNQNDPTSGASMEHDLNRSAHFEGPESSMASTMEHEVEARHRDATVHDPSHFEPLIGKSVVDINGDHVGDVEAVYYRELRMQPEWVAVTTGLVDRHRVLVPLDGYTDGEKIEVPYPKGMIDGAPVIEARVLDEDIELPLYAYYSARRILPGVESERHPEAVKLRSWAPAEPGRKEWAPGN